jgi:hypothetical protein
MDILPVKQQHFGASTGNGLCLGITLEWCRYILTHGTDKSSLKFWKSPQKRRIEDIKKLRPTIESNQQFHHELVRTTNENAMKWMGRFSEASYQIYDTPHKTAPTSADQQWVKNKIETENYTDRFKVHMQEKTQKIQNNRKNLISTSILNAGLHIQQEYECIWKNVLINMEASRCYTLSMTGQSNHTIGIYKTTTSYILFDSNQYEALCSESELIDEMDKIQKLYIPSTVQIKMIIL